MNKNEHEELNIKVHGKYVEVNSASGITAMAKCNPIDTFDIYKGVGIALSRYKEQKEEQEKELEKRKNFKPFVYTRGHGGFFNLGYVGEDSFIKDEFGESLKVGDTVKVKLKHGSMTYISTIGKIGHKFGVVGFFEHPSRDLIIVRVPFKKDELLYSIIETYEEEKALRKKLRERFYITSV